MVETSTPGEADARDGREELGFALSRELTPTRFESLGDLLPFSAFLDFCVGKLPSFGRDQSQGDLADSANAAEAAISLGVSELLSNRKLDTFVSDASGNFLRIPPGYWGGFHA